MRSRAAHRADHKAFGVYPNRRPVTIPAACSSPTTSQRRRGEATGGTRQSSPTCSYFQEFLARASLCHHEAIDPTD